MNNILQWIEGNFAVVFLLSIVLLLLNLLATFILSSRFAKLSQEIKTLSLGSYSWQKAKSSDLDQHNAMQASQISTSRATDHGLPGSLLIEKAIALIKVGTPISQIQSELGIDNHYLEILIKQHKQ